MILKTAIFFKKMAVFKKKMVVFSNKVVLLHLHSKKQKKMKRTDCYFALAIIAIFLPFVLCTPLYEWYKAFNASHGMVMSFLKFGILSTMGEMLGCRISTGKYVTPTFGVLPRMVVWGLLGMGINMAMIIFSKGTPMFMEYMGMTNAVQSFVAEAFSMDKLWVALAVSVAMNTIFFFFFMFFH